MSDLTDKLSRVDRGKKVTLVGYPQDETSEWHVQTSAQLGVDGDNRHVIVLQGTNHPDQWMTVAMTEREGELTIQNFAVAEGEPPQDGDDDAATAIDPTDVEITQIGRAVYSDRDTNSGRRTP